MLKSCGVVVVVGVGGGGLQHFSVSPSPFWDFVGVGPRGFWD